MSRFALLPSAGLIVSLVAACGGAQRAELAPPMQAKAREAPLVAPAPLAALAEVIAAPRAVEAPRLPAFPEGWIRGGAPQPLDPQPAPSPRSLRALAVLRAPRRQAVTLPMTLPLAELPVVEVKPEPDWSKEPTSPPSREEAPELHFDWSGSGSPSREVALSKGGAAGAYAMIGVRGQRFGFFDLNFFSSFSVPEAHGGLSTLCGLGGGTGYRSASWGSLTRAEGGEIRVEGATAWFDHHTCLMHVMTRISVLARPFADGLLYAFRTRCPSCTTQAEELHLIFPEQGWSSNNRSDGFHGVHSGSPFSHAAISLGPGAAGSIVARVTASALERFRKLGAPLDRHAPALLGVEVTRGASEPEATALFYVLDAPPE